MRSRISHNTRVLRLIRFSLSKEYKWKNGIKTNKMLYQVGTSNAILAGVYEGDAFFADLANYGNFGLGTFDAVNG